MLYLQTSACAFARGGGWTSGVFRSADLHCISGPFLVIITDVVYGVQLGYLITTNGENHMENISESQQAPELSAARNLSNVSFLSRFYGAFWGMYVGDALALPTHGYASLHRLHEDYGWVNSMMRPKAPFPESTLFRTHFKLVAGRNDILQGRDKEWHTPGTHFHQHLEAGDNTLSMAIAAELAQFLIDARKFDRPVFLGRYLDFMLGKDRHRDTYIPEGHLRFFENYGEGRNPEQCAEESLMIDGIPSGIPLILFYHDDVLRAQQEFRAFLSFTHRGEPLALAGDLIVKILILLLRGYSLEETLLDIIKSEHNHPALNHPYDRLKECESDTEVIDSIGKTGAHIEDALPVIFYLAFKYADNIGQALAVNANLGGASCERGAILGALLGAMNGSEELPLNWVESLAEYGRYDTLCDQLAAAVMRLRAPMSESHL